MCNTASSASFIGSRAHQRAAERPAWLQVRREMAGEGSLIDPAYARSQMSEHVKVVGPLLVQRGHVPICMLSRTSPQIITYWNAAGTLVSWTV